MTRNRRMILCALGSLALAHLVATTLDAQVIRTLVRDSLSGHRVGGAIVSLVGQTGSLERSSVSSPEGELTWKVAPGTYTIAVRKLGFEPKSSEPFAVLPNDTVSREVLLSRIPQSLATATIRGEHQAIRDSKFFGMRLGSIGSVIIAPSQVDAALPGANDFTDIVSRNPSAGFSVDYGRKCVLSNRGFPPACLPVIVDGMLRQNAAGVVPPEIVDYMLIVRGNELGVLYGSIGELGAVIIFTKRGMKRGPQDR